MTIIGGDWLYIIRRSTAADVERKTFSYGTSSQFLVSNAIYTGSNPTHAASYSNTNVISPNDWHLVVMTFSDDGDKKVRFYLNGNNETSYNWPQQVGLGTIYSDDARMQLGYIFGTSVKVLLDDIRIYNRVLSPIEISELYNSGNGCVL